VDRERIQTFPLLHPDSLGTEESGAGWTEEFYYYYFSLLNYPRLGLLLA
jgi:hypothetical protein